MVPKSVLEEGVDSKSVLEELKNKLIAVKKHLEDEEKQKLKQVGKAGVSMTQDQFMQVVKKVEGKGLEVGGAEVEDEHLKTWALAVWVRCRIGRSAARLTTRPLALVAEWLSEQHKTCTEGVRGPPAGHIPTGSPAQGSAGRQ